MSDQVELFPVDPTPRLRALPVVSAPVAVGTHRTDDYETSIVAGLAHLGRRGNQRRRIAFAFLRAHPRPLTDEEASDAAGLSPRSTPWKRCTELRRDGYIEATGDTRATSSGDQATVWRLTSAGKSALDELGEP